MHEHFKFFENRECEYYPCHKAESTIKEGEFNCLFCYCPLYTKEKCPGTPAYICDSSGRRLKDCSGCTFPHRAENYDKIIRYIISNDELISLGMDELFDSMSQILEEYCKIKQMDKETVKEHEITAERIYQRYIKGKSIGVLLQTFSGECVSGNGFSFGEGRHIRCNVLEKLRLRSDDIVEGCLYTFHAPDVDDDIIGSLSLLEQFYLENWMISSIDAGRLWIHDYLQRKHSVRAKRYVTDSFGPGFYGMSIDEASVLADVINSRRAGVYIDENGIMMPAKSSIGMYLVLNRDVDIYMSDCISCIGDKTGCSFCKNYGKRGI